MMSYTLFYCSNINSYFFCNLTIFIKKQQEYRLLSIPDTPVIFFDKFVLYKELQYKYS